MSKRRDSKPQPDTGVPGHVVVDSRGRNVWQWHGADTDSTTTMLKSLDNPDLALEPTRQVRRPKTAELDPASAQRRGRTMAQDADSGQPAGRPGASMTRAGQGLRPQGRSDAAAERSKLGAQGTGRNKIGGGFDPYNRS